MSLVFKTHVFHWYISRTQSSYDLFSFSNGYARIICAMYHEERCEYSINPVYWRNLLQKFSILLQAAILRFTQFAPPGTGVFKERHKIGYANNIHSRCPQIRIG